MMAIAGASRMSSVRGLNASPQTAIVFPFTELPKCAASSSTSRSFCASLTASTAFRIEKS